MLFCRLIWCRHHRSHSCWAWWARSNYPNAVEEGLIAFPGDPYVGRASYRPRPTRLTVSPDEVAWSPVMNHTLLPWWRDSLSPVPCHVLSPQLVICSLIRAILMISQSVVSWALSGTGGGSSALFIRGANRISWSLSPSWSIPGPDRSAESIWWSERDASRR